jgi:hypothetical protein
VFGPDGPPWERIYAVTSRELVEEWMRALTIFSNSQGRALEELLAEVSEVQDGVGLVAVSR